MTCREREPTTPGEILQEELLSPLGLPQKGLADHIGRDVKVVNRIVNGRSAVTTPMALELGSALGASPEFWLNAQKAVDLHRASREGAELPPRVRMASRAPVS